MKTFNEKLRRFDQNVTMEHFNSVLKIRNVTNFLRGSMEKIKNKNFSHEIQGTFGNLTKKTIFWSCDKIMVKKLT